MLFTNMDRKKITAPDRQAKIKRRLLIEGTIGVEALAHDLEVSVATIRRDLTTLEDTGFVQRTHGGAMVGKPLGADLAFSLREQTDQEAKRLIARAAIGLIDKERTLFLNDGSTMLAVAHELSALELQLTVVSCGINVATTVSENPRIQAYLAGGLVRHRTLGITGSFVNQMLSEMHADIAFIAPESVCQSGEVTFSYEQDAIIARKMSKRSKRTIVLATARKLQDRDRFTAMQADAIDLLITDCADPKVLRAFEEFGVEVLVVIRATDEAVQFPKLSA